MEQFVSFRIIHRLLLLLHFSPRQKPLDAVASGRSSGALDCF